MRTAFRNFIYTVFFIVFSWGVLPSPLIAATSDLEVSGWIPYWAVSAGTKDARKHLSDLTVIFPFTYSVKSDGSLIDLGEIKKSTWQGLFRAARKKDVLVIPTVMWSNTGAIYTTLSDDDARKEHIEEIVDMVRKGRFDGVDIDYEGKSAETHDSFARFLKDLKKKLGKGKILSCTIEARTPPNSLYKTMPNDLRYANDYAAIAKYCDRVNLMTYDQQRADLKLNEEHEGEPYVPVADPDWVRKVLELTIKSIPKEKISLGIATYGHEYEVIVYSDDYQAYNKTGAFNPSYGIKTAQEQHITPERGNAGEMSFSFFTVKTAPQFNGSVSVPKNTSEADRVAAQSFAYTEKTGLPSVFYYATWSDAKAIEEKIKLAEEFNLRGIALFKIDGNEDKNLWKLFD